MDDDGIFGVYGKIVNMKKGVKMKKGDLVQIKEYGEKVFMIVKQLDGYKTPVFLVRPKGFKTPSEFNGVMCGDALIKKIVE